MNAQPRRRRQQLKERRKESLILFSICLLADAFSRVVRKEEKILFYRTSHAQRGRVRVLRARCDKMELWNGPIVEFDLLFAIHRRTHRHTQKLDRRKRNVNAMNWSYYIQKKKHVAFLRRMSAHISIRHRNTKILLDSYKLHGPNGNQPAMICLSCIQIICGRIGAHVLSLSLHSNWIRFIRIWMRWMPPKCLATIFCLFYLFFSRPSAWDERPSLLDMDIIASFLRWRKIACFILTSNSYHMDLDHMIH